MSDIGGVRVELPRPLLNKINCSLHSAPKARDVKAWANGPGSGEIGRSAEGAEISTGMQ